MWKRYSAFLRKSPELTLAWQDSRTPARGWLVIDSTRNGAAGGGTRMHTGIQPREVVYLAKTMALKFAVAGPPIGGAKSGIDFDPADPRKPEVLERWYRAIRPYLRERYGTGGDLGVDEMTDVIPAFDRLGLQHPQEGVVRGHLDPGADRFREIIGNLDEGVRAPVCGPLAVAGCPLTVADMITGYGVAASVRRLFERQQRPLEGARVLLEGFGNVGAACGLYLARAGARIVAVADAEKVLVDPAGLRGDEVADLVARRCDKMLPEDGRCFRGDERGRFWDEKADVFVAAAISGSLTESVIERLQAAGVHTIACGANQPFRESRIGSTRLQQRVDRRLTILPDVLANCGMARAFSYLMESDAHPHAEPIFAAVDATIAETLDELLDRTGNRPHTLLAAALGLTLDRVGAPGVN